MDPKRDPQRGLKMEPWAAKFGPRFDRFSGSLFYPFLVPSGPPFWELLEVIFDAFSVSAAARAPKGRFSENTMKTNRFLTILEWWKALLGSFLDQFASLERSFFGGRFFNRFWAAPGRPGTPQKSPQTAPRRDQDAPQKRIKNWTPKCPPRDPKMDPKNDPKTALGGASLWP